MLQEKATASQREYEIVLLEELVPEDHLLRKIDAAVDFGFIHDLCKELYSPNIGRPAVPPELLFRMLFLGYLYGIKSEVKLAQMVNENIAFKWFLGLKLTEKGPDHATISINRVRRFRGNNIAEKVFDEILRQCVGKGLWADRCGSPYRFQPRVSRRCAGARARPAARSLPSQAPHAARESCCGPPAA